MVVDLGDHVNMKIAGLMRKQRNVQGRIFDFLYLFSLQGKRLAWAQEVDQRINTNGLPLKRYALTLTFFVKGSGCVAIFFVWFWFIIISILLYNMANRARYSKSREEQHALNARYLKFLIQVLINASIKIVFTFQVLLVKSYDFMKRFSFYSIAKIYIVIFKLENGLKPGVACLDGIWSFRWNES